MKNNFVNRYYTQFETDLNKFDCSGNLLSFENYQKLRNIITGNSALLLTKIEEEEVKEAVNKKETKIHATYSKLIAFYEKNHTKYLEVYRDT